MAGQEMCGYVDVKVPSRGRKFGLWKAWRRQWCAVRHGEGKILQLVIGNGPQSPASSIDIPHNAVLCRSESRSRSYAFGIFCSSGMARSRRPIIFLSGNSETESQQWMLWIRNLISPPLNPARPDELSVSLIENGHARTAGLAGLYGALSATSAGVCVRDLATGQRCAHLCWAQLAGVKLARAATPPDDGRVVNIATSTEFPSGEGQLRFYCVDGHALESALSRCRAKPPIRLADSPLPPLPSAAPAHALATGLLAARRLSRSEGDLRLWPPESAVIPGLFHLRTQSVSRHGSQHDKVASGLLNAGLGLMLTTPGCSEPDSLHDYQCLDALWSERDRDRDRDGDTLPPLPEFARPAYNADRRESGISVASGIYEEIEEQADDCYGSSKTLLPPPLPPRMPESSQEDNVPEEALIYSVPNEDEKEEEPLYLPMSPGGSKENPYVVMASLINKAHISEPVV